MVTGGPDQVAGDSPDLRIEQRTEGGSAAESKASLVGESTSPDLFVSYSRRDQPFVRRLAAALEARGRTVWVDWEILAAVPWRPEVENAIVQCQSFAFVVSPDSLSSSECAKEIECSTEHNKRFIPLLCRAVHGQPVPAPVSIHNWISFLEDDRFDRNVDTLIRTLDIDIEWLHAHTRLLRRAVDWDQSAADRSLVLRGHDLERAETWLGGTEGKQPEPTALQTQFILASRRAATRLHRFWTVGLALALVVTSLLATFAFLQRAQAVRQARIARSRELSATSVGRLDIDPELSLLLAIRAWDEWPTEAAHDALRQALQTSHVRAAFARRGHRATGVAVPSDPVHVAASYSDGSMWIWDVSTGRARALTGRGRALEGIASSPDGRRLLALGKDGAAVLRDATTGAQEGVLRAGTKKVNDAAFSQDGRLVATADGDHSVIVWDASTHERISSLRTSDVGAVTGVAFAPEGSELATASSDGALRIWDPSSGRLLRRIARSGAVAVAYQPHGQLLAVGTNDGTIDVWDRRARRFIATLQGHTGGVMSCAFNPSGRFLVTASRDRTARVWNMTTMRQTVVFRGHALAVSGAAFLGTGGVVTSSWDGTLRVWAISQVQATALRGSTGGLTSVAVSHGGAIAMGHADGTVEIWNEAGQRVRTFTGDTDQVQSVAFSPDGQRLVTASRDGTVQLREVATGHSSILLHSTLPETSTAFSADGRLIVAGGSDETVRIWDSPSLRLRSTITIGKGVVGVAVSPAGSEIAVAAGAAARLFDLRTGRRAFLRGHRGSVLSVAYSPDGSRLVTGGEDSTARVWDVAARRSILTLSGDTEAVVSAVFDATGRRIVTASSDGTARVWTASTGQLVEAFRPLVGALAAAAFSPSDQVAMVARAGAAELYTCDLCGKDLLELAETRITRHMTLSERRTYLHEGVA